MKISEDKALILYSVNAISSHFGMSLGKRGLALFMKGNKTRPIRNSNLYIIPTYGALSEKLVDVNRLIDELLEENLLRYKSVLYGFLILAVTQKSRVYLKKNKKDISEIIVDKYQYHFKSLIDKQDMFMPFPVNFKIPKKGINVKQEPVLTIERKLINKLHELDVSIDEISRITKRRNHVLEKIIMEQVRKDFKCIKETTSEINQKEMKILIARFGLENNTGMTLEEIGSFMGVTRERIRQIQAKAQTKISNKTIYAWYKGGISKKKIAMIKGVPMYKITNGITAHRKKLKNSLETS